MPDNSLAWSGAARIGAAWGAFMGEAGDNAPHRHHAIQIFAGPTACVVDGAHRERAAPGFVIPANTLHQARAAGTTVFFYVDPDSQTGRALAGLCASRIVSLSTTQATQLHTLVATTLRSGAGADPVAALAAILDLRHQQEADIDPRITSVISTLAEAEAPPEPRALAARIGLSVSRLTHLFSDEIGLPLRSFMLWTKLRRALEAVAAGATLTEAAHAGGFSDSAHFSRTCRKMFGINPQAMTGDLRFPA